MKLSPAMIECLIAIALSMMVLISVLTRDGTAKKSTFSNSSNPRYTPLPERSESGSPAPNSARVSLEANLPLLMGCSWTPSR